MRFYLHKAAAVAFLVFIGLWIVGSIRGMMLTYPAPPPLEIFSSGEERNYFRAPSNGANNLKQIPTLAHTPLPLVLDKPEVEQIRIFEKIAALTIGTTKFDADETLIRAAIKDYQAEVFNERKSGIAPGQRLMIEIGVNPDKFDPLVEHLKKVGAVATITAEKKDRTTEFRKLFGQQQAAKKRLERFTKRDAKALSFDESLRLEQKIEEIEKELQTLGVQFGDLLGKESYYHVHLTLLEHQAGDRRDHTYTIPQRIGHAFVWAIVWWFGVAGCVLLLAATGVSVWVLRQKPPA